MLLLIHNIAEAQMVKRYFIESGVVQYKISGGGEMMGTITETTGRREFYFKKFGALTLEKEHSTTVMSGVTKHKSSTQLLKKIDNTTVYDVDFKAKQIMKSTDAVASQYLTYGKNLKDDWQKILQKSGAVKVGHDKVLGYKCEIWNVMGSRQCLYKGGIPLKIETKMMGEKKTIIAVKATFNTKITDDKFVLPSYPVITSFQYISEEEAIKESKKRRDFSHMME